MAKYLIVGASAAGLGAVEAIREVDPVGTIIVVTEETCSHYSRPMISDFVSGKAELKKVDCRTEGFWEENKVEALIGKKVTALNFGEKVVQLEGGEKIPYEKL